MSEASNALRVVSVSFSQNASCTVELQDGNIPSHLSVVMNEIASKHDTYTLPPVVTEASLHAHPVKVVFVTVRDAVLLVAFTYTPPPRPLVAVQNVNVVSASDVPVMMMD